MYRTDLAYRRTAVEGASGFGLLLALYDTLAGDLRRAAEAQRANDIERRCREANHALWVIGFLEDIVRRGPGGDLAQRLIAFYGSLRRNLIAAQVKQSAEMFEDQMAEILKLRQFWQDADLRPGAVSPQILPPIALKAATSGYSTSPMWNSGNNWSA